MRVYYKLSSAQDLDLDFGFRRNDSLVWPHDIILGLSCLHLEEDEISSIFVDDLY